MIVKTLIGLVMLAIFVFAVRCLWDLFDDSDEELDEFDEDFDRDWDEFDEF